VSVSVDGGMHLADLVSWPGAPLVHLLRVETGAAEVTIESGLVSRDAVLALPPRLSQLQHDAVVERLLQNLFSGLPLGTVVPPRSTLTPRPGPARTPTPAVGH
jgi:hypothetical protein